MYDDAVFADRFRYQLAIFTFRLLVGLTRLLHAHIAYDTAFCRIFYCFARFDTVEINRMPCQNNKTYDDMVFADRFRYELTMFKVCIFTGLSRLLDTHISYEIVI